LFISQWHWYTCLSTFLRNVGTYRSIYSWWSLVCRCTVDLGGSHSGIPSKRGVWVSCVAAVAMQGCISDTVG
jgi:hypothetical protein